MCDTLSEAALEETTLVELPARGEVVETRWALAVLGEGVVDFRPLPHIGQLVLGRGEEATIRIGQPSLSRRHALLRVGAIVTVEDLGSRHGTLLAGQPLPPGQPRVVQPGDLLQLGSVLVALVCAQRRP